MTKYEFRTVPCPQRAQRDRKVTKGSDPFSETLTSAINELSSEGWDYIRTESIDVQKAGLFRRAEQRTFLVFRREIRPLVEPRQVSTLGHDLERVRTRRVKSQPLVQFVRNGGRKITPSEPPANTDMKTNFLTITAAE